MHGVTQPSSLAPGIQAGSRPSAAATLRLAANEAPEHQRARRSAERVSSSAWAWNDHTKATRGTLRSRSTSPSAGASRSPADVRPDAEGRAPSGVSRESNDPTDDVGLDRSIRAGHHLLFASAGARSCSVRARRRWCRSSTRLISVAASRRGGMLALRLPYAAPRFAAGRRGRLFFMRRIPQAVRRSAC